MSMYRGSLPQLSGGLFISEAGMETSLVFHEGEELPYFATFPLLDRDEGYAWLKNYFLEFAALARAHSAGAVFESATWRASPDWGAKLGYDAAALDRVQRKSIRLLEEVREEAGNERPIVISGNLGPRADGYVVGHAMSPAEAADYHRAQIETFADTDADQVCAMTLNYVAEGVGIARAAKDAKMPVVLSYTLETDGNLPTGETLQTAVERTDEATEGYPAYYMINCAHPEHFFAVLPDEGAWRERIVGLRANASRRSHAELDSAPDLDSGDPDELGAEYAELLDKLPQLRVLGGCCGTDRRHVERIASACRQLVAKA